GKVFRIQASKKNLHMKMVTTNQVKRLINACGMFTFLLVRPVNTEEMKVTLRTTLSTRQ
ncbi:hypothetical protein MKW92_007243, partial [Papaver armeniacum]